MKYSVGTLLKWHPPTDLDTNLPAYEPDLGIVVEVLPNGNFKCWWINHMNYNQDYLKPDMINGEMEVYVY